MATRENFQITSTEGHSVIKHKWNSSIRCTESLIGEIAKEERTTYSLVDSISNKEGFNHNNGSRTWESTSGKRVVFSVRKV